MNSFNKQGERCCEIKCEDKCINTCQYGKYKSLSKVLALLLSFTLLSVCFAALPAEVFASSPTDEILNYEITADVNDDATVSLTYHIDWLILDSDELGPLSWVSVGIPGSQYVSYEGLSDNISSIEYEYDYGTYLRIDFDRDYYEGETVSFDFNLVQDYMYEVDTSDGGHATYYFTPGWFDGIEIDSMVLRWNADKVETVSSGALLKDGCYTWETSLSAGESFSVSVGYTNDAFGFDTEVYDYDYTGYDDSFDFYTLITIVPFIIAFGVFIYLMAKAVSSAASYAKGSGFADGATEKKITRTKIVYYDSCPGCGAPRKEGKDTCEYCGRSLIKSEEIIEDENAAAEDKEAFKYKDNGEYHYGSDPNTFVRVNVVHIPVVHASPAGPGRSFTSGSGTSGRSHSSCVHSSCACASCACACACACAGGGRAGCSLKDFCTSKLKLRQLKQ